MSTKYARYSGSAVIVARIGRMDFTVAVGFSVIPGEPMVRYYPDGSGYPGSPPEIGSIDSVEVEEVEYPTDGPGYYEDTDTGQSYEYLANTGCEGWAKIAARWIRADLEAGMYDDELFAEGIFPDCED